MALRICPATAVIEPPPAECSLMRAEAPTVANQRDSAVSQAGHWHSLGRPKHQQTCGRKHMGFL